MPLARESHPLVAAFFQNAELFFSQQAMTNECTSTSITTLPIESLERILDDISHQRCMLLPSLQDDAILQISWWLTVLNRKESSSLNFEILASTSEADIIWLELRNLGKQLIQGMVGMRGDDDGRFAVAHLC